MVVGKNYYFLSVLWDFQFLWDTGCKEVTKSFPQGCHGYLRRIRTMYVENVIAEEL